MGRIFLSSHCISQHLPLSVSEWVGQWLIVSDLEIAIASLSVASLLNPNLLSFASLLFLKPLHGWWPAYWVNIADVLRTFFQVCTVEKNRSNHCVQSKSAVPTLALQCSVKGPKWIANSSIALHKVTKWVTSSSLCHYLKIVQCGLYGLQNVDDQL